MSEIVTPLLEISMELSLNLTRSSSSIYLKNPSKNRYTQRIFLSSRQPHPSTCNLIHWSQNYFVARCCYKVNLRGNVPNESSRSMSSPVNHALSELPTHVKVSGNIDERVYRNLVSCWKRNRPRRTLKSMICFVCWEYSSTNLTV